MTPEKVKENPTPRSHGKPAEPKQGSEIQLDATLSKALQTRFNLLNEEAVAYTALLIMGQLTPDQISLYSGLPLEGIDPVAKSLLDKNLIKVMPGVVKRYRAFAPYKELAEESKKFYIDTKAFQEELQGLTKQTNKEFLSQMRATSQKIRKHLENWNERQNTVIKEVATATKTVLKEVAGNLQQTLKEIAEESFDELSTQSEAIHKTFQKSVDGSLGYLEESQSKMLENVQNTIQEQQEAAEKWLSSVTSNLLQGLIAFGDQNIIQISDTNEAIQHIAEAGVTSTTTDITTRTEQIQQQIQDMITTIGKQIQTFRDEQHQAIDNWQKEQTISITRIVQDANQQFRESWVQRLQTFEDLVTTADKSLQRAGRQLSSATERNAAETDSIIQTNTQIFSQIGDELAQELQNAIREAVQGYQRLQKDLETAIANWPPTALTFSQFSKISETLSNVTAQFAKEYEGLLESIVKTVGVDMRDAHLTQLMDTRTLLEKLVDEVSANQKTLTTNIEVLSSELEKIVKRRLRSVGKTTNSFITDFETKIQLQEEQGKTLGQRARMLISQQGAAIGGSLIKANNQLSTFIQERLEPAQSAVEDLANTNITKISKIKEAFQKPATSFESAIEREIREINQAINQALDQLKNVTKQYADGIESTGDKLLEEQILQSETALRTFRTAIERQWVKRDRAIVKVLRSHGTKIKKNRQAEFDSLKPLIQDSVNQHAIAALSAYQTTLTKQLSALQEQAATTFQTTLEKRVQEELLSSSNMALQKALSKQIERSLMQFRERIRLQKSSFDKTVKSRLQQTRDRFTEIQQDHVSQMTEVMAEEISSQIEALFRDCKAKVRRQTQRDQQIDKAFQTTLDQLKQIPTTILPNLSKSNRTKLLKELEKAMLSCKAKVRRQTQRDQQIDKAFQTTLDQLKQIPKTTLSTLLEPLMDNQIIELQTALIDFQSSLETLQSKQATHYNEELQNCLAELNSDVLSKSIGKPLQDTITQHAAAALSAYQTTLTKQLSTLQEQAATTFQTTFNKRLQNKTLVNLVKLASGITPTITDLVDQTSQEITESIHQADADSWQQTEKHWSPLARFTEEYTTTLAGNLTALNTAISTALDRVAQNVAATLTSFQEEARKILENTIQEFAREQKTMIAQATLGITEMKEGCLSNITEARTLLDALSTDLASQRTNLETEIETTATELETTVTTNFDVIHETADAFIQDYQRRMQLQTKQVQNLKDKVKTLLLQEGSTATNILTTAKNKLHKFIQDQVSQTQKEIEELETTCATRIDDYRSIFRRTIESLTNTLTEESEDYIASLQEEIELLQKGAMDVILKSGETGETLNAKLSMRIETGMLNFQTAIGEQRSSLDSQISSHYAELKENFEKIHTNLIEKQTQETQAGRLALEETLNQVTTMLEKSIQQTNEQTGVLGAEHKKILGEIINDHSSKMTNRLGTITAEIIAALDQAVQTVTAILTDTQEDTSKLLTTITKALDRERTKFTKSLKQEEAQTQKILTQNLALANTRVNQAVRNGQRRANETMRTAKETMMTDVQQQVDSIITTIKEFVNSAEDRLSTQPQKAGQHISHTLRNEQKQLKLESQTLAKEILAVIHEAEITSIQPLQNFIKMTESHLKTLQKQVYETEKIMLGLWNTLTEFRASEAERIWYIVSTKSIHKHLQDMLRRTNSTITLVYPSFEEVPLNQLANVSPDKRIHLITSLDGEKHQSKINKLLQQSNIRLWQSPQIQYYGGTRDGEEVLIAPVHDKPSETVAVVSDQLNYVALFNQTLGPRWLAASKEIIRRESEPG